MIRYAVPFLLFSSLIALSIQISAQSVDFLEGRVMDGESNLPLPGVSIRIEGKTKGVVTNADGVFQLPGNVIASSDRIILSHVGYEPDTLAIARLRKKATVWLHPSSYQLEEVVVSSKQKSEFPYQLLYDAIKHYRFMQDPRQSKAYFLLQSESNGVPLEIIEAYYNCMVSPGRGIENFTLINGRIGISSINDKNYLSVNTTQLLKDIAPFYEAPGNPFPESPGTTSYTRLKRIYKVTIRKYLKRDGKRYFVVEFIPRKNREYFFSGVVYINEADLTIDKLEYRIADCQVPILHPIDPNDRIKSMQLAVALYFDNTGTGESRVDRISLGYQVEYLNSLSLKTITLQTKAEVFLYDYRDTFPPPMISKAGFNTDYQAILTIPYQASFWEQHEIMAPSARQQEVLAFFKQQGILVHYNNPPNEYLKADIKEWSSERPLDFSDLTGSPGNTGGANLKEPSQGKYMLQQDLYKIRGDILIQPFLNHDTLSLHSKTILHLADSYFYADENQSSKRYINLLFDLYEVYRIKILAQCFDLQASGNLTIHSLEELYSSEMKSLDSLSRVVRLETKQGSDQASIKKWNRFIVENIGLDRQL